MALSGLQRFGVALLTGSERPPKAAGPGFGRASAVALLSWLALGGIASGQTYTLSGTLCGDEIPLANTLVKAPDNGTASVTRSSAFDLRVTSPVGSRSGLRVPLAQPSPALVTTARASVAAFVAAEAFDVITTASVLRTGRAREANPILPQGTIGITAVKLGVTAGVSFVFWKLSRKHPRVVLIGAGILTATTMAGAIHNAHILESLR